MAVTVSRVGGAGAQVNVGLRHRRPFSTAVMPFGRPARPVGLCVGLEYGPRRVAAMETTIRQVITANAVRVGEGALLVAGVPTA